MGQSSAELPVDVANDFLDVQLPRWLLLQVEVCLDRHSDDSNRLWLFAAVNQFHH